MFMAYIEVAAKLAIGLTAFIIVLRTTGRGQLNNMTPLDLIGNFVLGGIIGGVIYNQNISILQFILVLAIWEVIIIIANALKNRSYFLRKIIIGKVTPVIVDDKFQLDAFDELGLDINDFATLLRMQGASLNEVSYAQIEPNNQVSIIRKDDKKSLAILIKKGEIDKETLTLLGHDETWLTSQLKKQSFEGDIKDIYFAEWMGIKDNKDNLINDYLYIIPSKEESSSQ